MLNILITGATGFIGTHLINSLIEKKYNVTIITSQASYIRKSSDIKIICTNFFECNDAKFDKILESIDIVYHLLWTTNPRKNQVFEDLNHNVMQGVKFLDACVRNKIKKVIFPSTGGALYGNTNDYIIDEKTLPTPISSYGLTKLTIEKYIELLHHHHGLEYAILRISSAYGEYQGIEKKQGVITTWLNCILNNQPIEIWGNGEIIRDYIYVKDVANALTKAIFCSHSQTMNIGTGKGYSLNEILIFLKDITSNEIDVRYKDLNNNDVRSNILDNSVAKEALDWTPRYTITEGIEKTFQFYKSKQ